MRQKPSGVRVRARAACVRAIESAGAVIALASLIGAAPAVNAQQGSGVTLFGIIDSGVEHLRDIGPQKLSLTRVPTQTGTVASRVGLRGSEDLGAGCARCSPSRTALRPTWAPPPRADGCSAARPGSD